MERPLGAQIAHLLRAHGVEVVFGIPGVHNIGLYRGLKAAGIRHVLARHEQGAGFMADGYARASGRPGVAFTISGPGLCNLLAPLGQAYSDSVPVLALSSCLDETAARRGQLHQMRDQAGAAAALCDWSEVARTPEAAFGLIERAFAEFASARARPKHLNLPIGLMEAPAGPVAALRPDLLAPRPDPAQMAEAAELVLGAKRPLFIFGGGARGASQAARALVACRKAASMVTLAGRGIIPDGAPGAFGPVLARPGATDIVASADLLVVVGSELAETDLWRAELGHAGPMIRVDLDAEVLADSARAELPVLADARVFLEELLALVEPYPARASGWKSDEVQAARVVFREEVEATRPGIAPIVAALAAGLDEEAMIYSDMTQFAYLAKELWPMRRPGHWHHPYGFGTLGYALPAAIGGALARPGAPTLAIAGDYGFQFTLAELAVALEQELSLPVLLWDNGGLGEIESCMEAAGIDPGPARLQNPDFLSLAKAYGADAVAPESLGALVEAVNAAFAAGRPTLIRMTPALTA